MIFLNSFTLLQMDRLQLTAVYCTRRGVNTIPQMTCLRGAKVCTKWLQGKVMMNCYSMIARLEFGHEVENSGKWKICGLVTKHNANANDNMYACVELHDTDTNDNIYYCVAPHDAYTCKRFN